MKKSAHWFLNIKELCLKIHNTRAGGDEWLAIAKLRKAIREWQEHGEDTPTLLFSATTHAGAHVYHLGNPDRAATREHAGNELYEVVADDGVAVMTGQQLDSLAGQWLAFRKGEPIQPDSTIRVPKKFTVWGSK